MKRLHGGRELTVTLGKQKIEKSGIVDAEVAAKIKKSLDLSKRHTSHSEIEDQLYCKPV